MQSKINKYSYTLFTLAKNNNLLETVYSQLGIIKQMYKKETCFRLLFESKRIDEDTKCNIVRNTFGKFDKITVEFLCIVISHKKIIYMIKIINKFLNLAKKELNKNKLEIITAEPITEEFLNQLFNDTKYQIETRIDSSLIGGIKIKHRNKIFDNSIISQLNQLKKTLHNM